MSTIEAQRSLLDASTLAVQAPHLRTLLGPSPTKLPPKHLGRPITSYSQKSSRTFLSLYSSYRIQSDVCSH